MIPFIPICVSWGSSSSCLPSLPASIAMESSSAAGLYSKLFEFNIRVYVKTPLDSLCISKILTLLSMEETASLNLPKLLFIFVIPRPAGANSITIYNSMSGLFKDYSNFFKSQILTLQSL